MRYSSILFGGIGLALGIWAQVFSSVSTLSAASGKPIQESKAQLPAKGASFIIAGNFLGSLGPCGCSAPMVGGIKRIGTIVRQNENSWFIVNGGMVKPADSALTSKQNQLKTEALAEAFNSLGAVAINLSANDASGGQTPIEAISRLSGRILISGSIQPTPDGFWNPYATAGNFLIGGGTEKSDQVAAALGSAGNEADSAVKGLVNEAKAESKAPILLWDGAETTAEQLANQFPALRLIVFNSQGTPPSEPKKIGSTLIVSPGDEGKNLIEVNLTEGSVGYRVINLGPDVPDDPEVASIEQEYLARVKSSRLLALMPRLKTKKFGGSSACLSCHATDQKIWAHTAHARALKSLISVGHQFDPDCITCHVTGIKSTFGYQSLGETPQFANVTCESCHGPALDHARNPRKFHLAKVGLNQCLTCHTPENSPNFNADSYWHKIKHG